MANKVNIMEPIYKKKSKVIITILNDLRSTAFTIINYNKNNEYIIGVY